VAEALGSGVGAGAVSTHPCVSLEEGRLVRLSDFAKAAVPSYCRCVAIVAFDRGEHGELLEREREARLQKAEARFQRRERLSNTLNI
jgi:hypothetical protein